MPNPAIRFTRAIARLPAPTAVDGLRAVDTGPPDPARMLRDHAIYVAALRDAGIEVTVLPALPAYPDALFVEDTALCLPQGVVLMRPGAPSRLGEVSEIRPALAAHYDEIREIAAPGHIEGGDILYTGRDILVGRSSRTDPDGIAQLRALVADWGHSVREVATPPGVLHFKTDCALLDDGTILATRRLSASGCFDGYRLLHPAPGEDAAANCIRVNDLVLLPAGFPGTAALLRDAGFEVREIPNDECARLDGGMSCLSLRF